MRNYFLNICIPLPYLIFEDDVIQLSDDVKICKMDEDFQLSRFNAVQYHSIEESNLMQTAIYMIKITGLKIDNKEKASFENVISNNNLYPLVSIDNILAALRISTGYNTGYSQLLVEPIEWSNRLITDLIPLYGVDITNYNRNDLKTPFLQYSVDSVSNMELQTLKIIFSLIDQNQSKIGDSKLMNKEKEGPKKVMIALNRLNRCMLREASDDTALDAIIGIEALLSGGTQGEITYTISNRFSFLATKLEECQYCAADSRKALKKIYGLRSDIVHGRIVTKNKSVIINEEDRDTTELALEFLRFTILFILKNQEYYDVTQFEKSIDIALDKFEQFVE